MDTKTIIHDLKVYAAFLKQTRLPAEEMEAANRIMNCAGKMEQIAKEMEANEGENQPEQNV